MGEKLRESAEELICNQSMFSLMFNQMGKFLFPSLLWYPPRNMIDLNVSESNPSQNFSALNVSSTVNFRNKKWSQAIFYMNPLSWKDVAKGQHICLSPWLYFPNLKFFPQLVWCYWGLTPHTSKILDLFAHALINSNFSRWHIHKKHNCLCKKMCSIHLRWWSPKNRELYHVTQGAWVISLCWCGSLNPHIKSAALWLAHAHSCRLPHVHFFAPIFPSAIALVFLA